MGKKTSAPVIQLHPVPDDEVFTQFYAWFYDRTMVEALRKFHEAWNHGIQTACVIHTDAKGVILDAGVGTGRVTAALLRSNPDVKVVGFDRSLPFLKVAQRRLAKVKEAHGRVVLQQGDLTKPFPYADNSFDGVTMNWVFQYLSKKDQQSLLGEFKRVMKPGSKLYLNISSVPFAEFVPIFLKDTLLRGEILGIALIMLHQKRVRQFIRGYKTGEMYLPTQDELIGLLLDTGFTPVQVKDYAYLPEKNKRPFVAFIEATA